MEHFYRSKIIPAVAVIAMTFSVISLILSLNSNNPTNDNLELIKSIKDIKSNIHEIQERIDHLDLRVSKLQNYRAAASLENRPTVNETSNETTLYQNEAIKRLEDIIESSGLDNMAESGITVDSELLEQMTDRRTRFLEFRERLSELRAFNREQTESDQLLYGDDLISLYTKANVRMRGEISDDQKQAFTTLLNEYPDSYSTAKVISTFAARSVRNGDLGEAEAYIEMLRDFEERNSTTVALDIGFEAMPVLLNSLSRAYYRNGNNEKAKTITKELETNYPDAAIPGFRRQGRFSMAPAP